MITILTLLDLASRRHAHGDEGPPVRPESPPVSRQFQFQFKHQHVICIAGTDGLPPDSDLGDTRGKLEGV